MTNLSNRKKFSFSENWFDKFIPHWNQWLKSLSKKKINVLEIGAFEGASTTWILEELLIHPESSLISIDTFKGSLEHKTKNHEILSSLENRFYSNIEKTNKKSQLQVIKGESQ